MEDQPTAVIEVMDESAPFSGVVKKGKKEFFYYPEEAISFQGEAVDYFHFKKPTLKKAKAHNVVLGNELSARHMEALVRSSLLRIAKKEGGEFMSCHYREILDDVDMDEMVEMTNHCSNFFVKTAG